MQEFAYTLYQLLVFLETQVHDHPVQVYLEPQDQDYHPRNLLLFHVGQVDLIPEFKDAHLPCQDLLGIGCIPADNAHSANQEGIINIALECSESLLEHQDPDNE